MRSFRKAREILGIMTLICFVLMLLSYGRNGGWSSFSDGLYEGNRSLSSLHGAFYQDPDLTSGLSRDLLFARRRNRVSESCRAFDHLAGERIQTQDPVVVIGEKKLFQYCAIAKSGTTFWKAALAIIESQSNYTELYDGHHYKSLPTFEQFRSNHTDSELKQFLESASSFMFVREPYSRLFSAYIDKLFRPNVEFYQTHGRAIATSIRQMSLSPDHIFGHDVSFSELIKYIILQRKNNVFIDRHFAPMHSRCNPCTMRFDYIGKMETFADDARYIIEEVSAGSGADYVKLLELDKESNKVIATARVKALFEVLQRIPGLTDQKFKLFLKVWRSFQIRGILSTDIEMPLSEGEILTKNQTVLQNLLVSALEKSMNITEMKMQRVEALLQAYSTIPRGDLWELKDYVEADCELFGYEKEPKWLTYAMQNVYKPRFDYFDTL